MGTDAVVCLPPGHSHRLPEMDDKAIQLVFVVPFFCISGGGGGDIMHELWIIMETLVFYIDFFVFIELFLWKLLAVVDLFS